MRSRLRFFLLMFLYGLAFDFRGGGEAGPSIAQYLFLTVSVTGGFGVIVSALLINHGRIVIGSRFGIRVLLITLAFCAWAPVAVLVSSDTAHDDFVSVILPYLLYGQGLLVVLLALQSGIQERTIIRTLVVVSVVSCAWRLVYAVTIGGVELASARWQILSPALPLILGASVAAFHTRTNRPLAVFAMIYFLTIVTLSITRGYLVGLAAVLFATIVTTRGRGSALFAPKALGRMTLVVISVGMALAVLTMALPSEVGERWLGRLAGEKSNDGEEITLLIRLAQFKGQYDGLTQSTATMLAGRGFGASFVVDEGLLSSLAFIAPDEVVESTNGSDSTWGYPIFAHGVIFGPLFLISVLMLAVFTIKTCRRAQASGPEAFRMYFVSFSFAALMGISLTGNIFSERLGGVLIGSLAALALHQGKKTPERSQLRVTDNPSETRTDVAQVTGMKAS